MKSRLLVLLGILCHLQDGSAHTEEEEEKYIIIKTDEMEGHIKIPGEPCFRDECLYYIDPLENHIVTLRFEGIRSIYANSPRLFYYSGNDTYEKDMVFLGTLDRISHHTSWRSPVNYGFYLNMTGVQHEYGDEMRIHYMRIPADTTDICPFPIILANKTTQRILPQPFGCGYRINVPKYQLLTLVKNCSNEVDFDAHFVLENGPSVDLEREDLWGSYSQGYKNHWGANGQWDVIPYDLDLTYYSNSKDNKTFCPITYFALEKNPCNCSKTTYNLSPNEPITLTSPGWPSLLCPLVVCDYNLTVEKTGGSETINSFVIRTTHLPQDELDLLQLVIDGETVQLEKHGNNHMNLLTGHSLQVQYQASSVISLKHGFEMTVEAIETPLDCLCSSNRPKQLRNGQLSMSFFFPAHCSIIFCRYHIINPDRSDAERVLHVEMNYTLQHSKEVLTLLDGEQTHVFYHPVPGKRYDSRQEEFHIKKAAVLTYMRDVNGSSLAESSFNMTWKWVTSGDCTCGETSLTAAKVWKSLYSPGYPQDYCSDMNCTYSIRAPESHHVQLAVLSFETEPHSDFLTVFEGNRTLKRLAGRKKERISLETVGPLARLQFTSDHSITYRGYKIMYLATPDPGFSPEESTTQIFLYLLALLVILIITVLLAYKKLLCFKYHRGRADTFENPTFGYSASENIVIEKN